MTYIRNNKTLVFIIAILLLSNIALLYFLMQTRKDCNKSDKPKDESTRHKIARRLKDEVGFDTTQVAKYEEMSKAHKEAMKPLFENITNAKDSLYKLLMQPDPSDSAVNYYLDMVGERQQMIDQRIFNHFMAVRELSTAAQRPKFDSTIQNVIKGWISFPNNKKK